jgi:hypothetical protein
MPPACVCRFLHRYHLLPESTVAGIRGMVRNCHWPRAMNGGWALAAKNSEEDEK